MLSSTSLDVVCANEDTGTRALSPNNAGGIINVGLSFENTLLTLLRLQFTGLTSPPSTSKAHGATPSRPLCGLLSLASGFETGPSFLAS